MAVTDPASQAWSDFRRSFQASGLTAALIGRFRDIILTYYDSQGRDLPWRRTSDPYAILVSEIMLQQTQVARVLDKYGPFLDRFPSFAALAEAELRDILLAWQGLGYNRRAKALQGIARQVVAAHGGSLPARRTELERLPGIGSATAGAVLAFAFEQPVVFLETNIRRVYLHFFYPETTAVTDQMLWPLVLMTMDAQRVRQWYYALMDYGAMLKKLVANPNRRSAHYTRQSPFPGSDRELRSRILRRFLDAPQWQEDTLMADVAADRDRLRSILADLVREQFLQHDQGTYRLAGSEREIQ